MSGKPLLRLVLAVIAALALTAPCMAAQFPDKPHDDVTIEWWYLNAHLTTRSGKHLAGVCCFFRFGNSHGRLAEDSNRTLPQCHYLIWGVTDEVSGAHRDYSFADANTLKMLRVVASLAVIQNPSDDTAEAFLNQLNRGRLPPPTVLLSGSAVVGAPPLRVLYSGAGTLSAVPGKPDTYRLRLASGGEGQWDLTFAADRPTMYVGGDGNTGIEKPADMKYVSLSRCSVSGAVGHGDPVASGQGWIDHQWGNTWTSQRYGWDWFGVQLDDGSDIDFFRQRDSATGEIIHPTSTFEDGRGRQATTHKIVFTPDKASIWTSPTSGTRYPLHWSVVFPDKGLTLDISPDANDQEMPVLASGGFIWEGSCTVRATYTDGRTSRGVAYMELVGYNSPSIRKSIPASKVTP